MDNKPVLFIDSGIGGLPYCRDFLEKNPQEEVCYLADTKNFPYGSRGKEELRSILTSLIEKLLKEIDPKIIVLACNTATVSALDTLREQFKETAFVGTVPAIKPAANASVSGKVGVLGTARTIEDPYNQNLLNECEKKCEIIALAAPELVEFVEQRFDKAEKIEKTKIVKKYIEHFRAKGADTLVLGCTHFLYLLEEFRREAAFASTEAPSMKIFDSLDGITKRLEHLLDENGEKLRCSKTNNPEHKLLLTKTEPVNKLWQDRAKTLGFEMRLCAP